MQKNIQQKQGGVHRHLNNRSRHQRVYYGDINSDNRDINEKSQRISGSSSDINIEISMVMEQQRVKYMTSSDIKTTGVTDFINISVYI